MQTTGADVQDALQKLLAAADQTPSEPAAPDIQAAVKPDFNPVPATVRPPAEPLPDNAWATWPVERLALRCGVRGGRGGPARATLPEEPEVAMRYMALLWQHGPLWRLRQTGGELAAVANQMAMAAARARKALTPMEREYYAKREQVRALGQDPDTVEKPTLRDALAAQQEDARLLAEGPRDIGPFLGRTDDYSRQQRELIRMEERRHRELLAEQARERKRVAALSAKQASVMAEGVRRAEGLGTPSALQVRRRAIETAGRVRYLRPWAERVLDDIALVLRRGRPLPVAARHPRSSVPLAARQHPAHLDKDLQG